MEEDSEIEEKILAQFDFTEIDMNLAELFPEEKLNFADTVSALIHGDLEPSKELFVQLVQDQISYEFRYNKNALAHILIISVFAATAKK